MATLRTVKSSPGAALNSIWGSFVGGVAIGVVEALVVWNYPVGGVLELVLAVVILISMLAKPGLGRTRGARSGADWTLTHAVRPLPPSEARVPLVRAARYAVLTAVVVLAALAPLAVRPSLRAVTKQDYRGRLLTADGEKRGEVSVGGDDYALLFLGTSKNVLVGRCLHPVVADVNGVVPGSLQVLGQHGRERVVDQELHPEATTSGSSRSRTASAA